MLSPKQRSSRSVESGLPSLEELPWFAGQEGVVRRVAVSLLLPLSGEVRPEEEEKEEEEESPGGRGQQQERTDVLGSHDEALALLGPRVALLVRGVDQRVRPLVLLNVLAQRLDRLGQRPPLHLGLIPEVFDLLLDAFFIHGDGGGSGRRTGDTPLAGSSR